MNERVSVVIPVLNEEKTIKKCLICLLNQTEKPFEVIVVDNGSADKSSDIIKSLKNKFNSKKIDLRYFYYPKGNQTNAREFGIKKSKGEIIGSLDADACPDKNWISEIRRNLQDPKIIGIGGRSTFRNKGRIFNLFYFFNYYLRLLINLYCIGGGNSAFRKSAFISVKGHRGLENLRKEFNIIYAKDDYFLSKKLEQKGRLKFCFNMNVTLLHRIRNTQNQKQKEKYYLKDVLKRALLEITYDYKISKFFKSKHQHPIQLIFP